MGGSRSFCHGPFVVAQTSYPGAQVRTVWLRQLAIQLKTFRAGLLSVHFCQNLADVGAARFCPETCLTGGADVTVDGS